MFPCKASGALFCAFFAGAITGSEACIANGNIHPEAYAVIRSGALDDRVLRLTTIALMCKHLEGRFVVMVQIFLSYGADRKSVV